MFSLSYYSVSANIRLEIPVIELITELEVNQNFKEQYDLFNDQF